MDRWGSIVVMRKWAWDIYGGSMYLNFNSKTYKQLSLKQLKEVSGVIKRK